MIAAVEIDLLERTRTAQARGWREPYRGSITDYARAITLGAGYMVPDDNVCRNCAAAGIRYCRHFEIDTCRQLAGPFAAMDDPNVWLTMVAKATQTLGSLTWDLALHYLIVHSRYMRIKIFLDSDEKARKYCDERLMDTLRRNPDIAPLLPVGGQLRHDDRKAEIKFINGKVIVVGGLNDSNTSSLSGDCVIIDEGWEHGSDGQMTKAIDRTKQVAYRKVIVVGRAGRQDEDQDKIWQTLDKHVPVTWACPCCGSRQSFDLRGPVYRRAQEFKPVLVTDEMWRAFRARFNLGANELPLPPAPPKPLAYAGLKLDRPLSEIGSGEDIKAAALAATLECYHCGFNIPDTKPMRRALMASYEQEYRIPGPHGYYTPPNYSVGFWNPDPVSVTIPFAQTMRAFILAKKASTSGNRLPVEDFYMDRWARAWDESLIELRDNSISVGSYDPNEVMPHEHSRDMAVDCQQNQDHYDLTGKSVTGWFWYVVRVFDKAGNSRQLARGFVKSWDAWVAVQKHWKIPNDRVVIDVLNFSTEVIQKAVEFREVVKLDRPHPIFKSLEKTVTWKLVASSPGKQNFKGHKDNIVRPWSPESSILGAYVDKDGRTHRVQVSKIIFNKTPIRQQVDALYSGAPGLPKFEWLKRDQLRLISGEPDKLTLDMEKLNRDGKPNVLCYEMQMSAQIYNQRQNDYDELRPDDHYYWCEQALQVRVGMDGLFGHSAVFATAEVASDV